MTARPRRRTPAWLPPTAPPPPPREDDGRPVDSVDRSAEALAAMPAWRRTLTHPGVLWAPAAVAYASGLLVLALLFRAFGESREHLVGPDWTPWVAAVIGYALVLRLERRHPVELTRAPVGHLLRGLLLGAALMVLVVVVLLLLDGLMIYDGYRGAMFAGEHGGSAWLWVALAVGVSPAVVHELLLRGVVLRFVEQGLGTWAGLLVSAAASGAMVLPLMPGWMVLPLVPQWTGLVSQARGPILSAAVVGLMLGALYVLTRSLWLVVGVHSAWNLVQGLVVGSRVGDGSEWGGLWGSSPTSGPALLTGGYFGVEASIVAALVCGVVAVVALVPVVRRGLVVAPAWSRRAGEAATTVGERRTEAAIDRP